MPILIYFRCRRCQRIFWRNKWENSKKSFCSESSRYILVKRRKGMRIEQANIRLRLLTRDDFEALWKLYTPAIFEHMLTKVESFEQLCAWLETGIKGDDVLIFAVEDSNSGSIVGTTRIYAIDKANKSCEIGSTFYAEAAQ